MIKKTIIGLSIVFLTSALPVAAQTVDEDVYRVYLLSVIELLQQQILLLQTQAAAEVPMFYEPDSTSFSSFLIEDYDEVVDWYRFSNPALISNITDIENRQYLERFFEIVPDEYDDYFIEFLVFEAGAYDFDGFVETVEPFQEDTWRLGINEEMFEFGKNSDPVEELFVHEFAHIVSYEGMPNKVRRSFSTCHEFFGDFGCPPSNSYLLDFTDEYWTDDQLDELVEADDPLDLWTNAELNENFVTDYAATNPAEDFAESFTFFVLEDNKQNENKLYKEKINYFYDYSPMVELRQQIRAEL